MPTATTRRRGAVSARSRSIPVADLNSREGKSLLKKIIDARDCFDDAVSKAAAAIISDVRENGDEALAKYTKRFDGVRPAKLRIPPAEIAVRARRAPPELKIAIRETARRLRQYHSCQGMPMFKINTPDGEIRQAVRPLNRVGLYIPGGRTVYPSSVLMNVVPAQSAGVKEIVAVTPPQKDGLDAGVAFALNLLGITEVYQAGGAQAVAALAYGTETITPVDKIVGPGNAYVAAAKRLVYGKVDIDCVAGPSEVVIVADKSADSRLVALDLLAQAEHGTGDEIAVCIVESKILAAKIAAAVTKEINASPSKADFMKLPPHAITIFVTTSRAESLELCDTIAPEHLQLMTETANDDAWHVANAAAIFIGSDTPTALGDYFIGTNHVLPTGGTARFASPLGVESFQKRISIAKVSLKGLKSAMDIVPTFARAEAFHHHALSVEARGE
ncbi:MAG: histidinol dehydrogenase [Chitinispirillales bacterium]|jgi:histidinol dehydrogenase|nr:histidinol dehydrogenase [Chitinispirillales bacterium]